MLNNTEKLFKGISVQTLVTISTGVLEIIVFSIMSRLLSKVDFGYYAAISGVMAILLSITEAGLGASVIQKKDASKDFISTAFTLSCITGFIGTVLLLIFAPYLSNLIADSTLTLPLQIIAINIFLHGIISVGNGILYRKLAFKTIGLINICSHVISSIVAITMAINQCGLYSVVVQNVVYSLLYLLILFIKVRFPDLKININNAKEIISFGGWLTLGVIFNNLTHQLDKLLLPKWMSVETLGAYNRPAGFVSTISTKINGIFDTVLFPMLSDFQDDKTKVISVFKMSVSLLNSFSIILAAIFFFNSNLIITIFFGDNWLELIPVLQIISISVIFNINGRLVDCFFRSLAYVKLGFFLRVLSAIITLGCLYCGSLHGICGVATAIVIANITNILIKMSALSIKTKTSICGVVIRMINAWRSVIPIIIVGIPFLLLESASLGDNICFALLFAIIVVIEFTCFPKFVGDVYYLRVYPIVKNILNKVRK